MDPNPDRNLDEYPSDWPDIYAMELHQSRSVGPVECVRVPGGWVYQNAIGGMCFVPFHNEFQKPPSPI